jgi:hypothetical protein
MMRPVPTKLPSSPASPPPFPNTVRGSATFDGEPARDGIEIYAEIVEGNVLYATPSVLVADGKFNQLSVQPPSTDFHNATINFYAWIDGAGVQAAETVPFNGRLGPAEVPFVIDQDLTFTTSGS